MEDTGIMVVAIFLAAIIMFIYPLTIMADKNDDISSLTIQSTTTEFTNNVRKTGRLTQDDYDNFLSSLASTGNSYNVEITIQILDDNPARVETTNTQSIGENRYYTLYTTQVREQLPLILKDGDIISVNVRNTNSTIAMQLRNYMYRVTGNNLSTITASASGIVTTNGK